MMGVCFRNAQMEGACDCEMLWPENETSCLQYNLVHDVKRPRFLYVTGEQRDPFRGDKEHVVSQRQPAQANTNHMHALRHYKG